jgi:F-type H+-transporting ATPase subunit gamma
VRGAGRWRRSSGPPGRGTARRPRPPGAARPYARALDNLIAEICARAGRDAHPLLVECPARRVDFIVVTSDRGLCGAYNTNVCRKTEAYLRDNQLGDVSRLVVVGKKGQAALKRRRGLNITTELPGVAPATALERARQISELILQTYLADQVDAVYLVYNEFKNAVSQRVTVERLLPIKPKELAADAAPVDYLYEPSRAAVLDHILPMWVEVEVYRALLEAVASEYGAKMSAMEAATGNAAEMISKLTTTYNRARQAAITKELSEIVGGAEALKG